MINLETLTTVKRHPLSPVFKKYSKLALANALGCSQAYFSNALLGHVKPSKDLEEKIAALAAEIQHAEAAQHPSTQSKESK